MRSEQPWRAGLLQAKAAVSVLVSVAAAIMATASTARHPREVEASHGARISKGPAPLPFVSAGAAVKKLSACSHAPIDPMQPRAVS